MMKQWVIAGTLATSLAAVALAPQTAAASQQTTPAKPSASTAAQQKPATGEQKEKPRTTRAKPAEAAQAETRTPKQQPNTAPDPDVPVAATALGTVNIPRAVKADGKPLAAGTYQVRLTTDEAKPDAVGTSGKTERWAEFVQKGQVKGREVVTIVPQSEIKLVQKDAPPAANGSKVQMLKGNDYLRVWINRGGNHYLIHLVAA
jgi:hypothetical protein